MTKRYRLLTRAQLHGEVRDPGFIFTLDEGELGPHRTVVASNHGSQITDHMNSTEELLDQPLYEEVKDPEPQAEKPEETTSPEHAADKARIADLERQLVDKDKQLGEAHWRLGEVDAALKVAAQAPESEPAKS